LSIMFYTLFPSGMQWSGIFTGKKQLSAKSNLTFPQEGFKLGV